MSAFDSIRAHPWITAIVVACSIGGGALTFAFAPEEMSPMRRILGGVLAGAGIAAIIVLTRAIGAFGEDDETR